MANKKNHNMELTKKQIYQKKYYQENKESIDAYRKIYYKENKKKISSYTKTYNQKYYKENKEKMSLYNKIYNKKYNQENKDKIKKYYQENKEKIAEYYKLYNQENKDMIRQRKNKYNNSSPIIKLRLRLRARVKLFFNQKGHKKKNSTEEILGANWKTVEAFMEAKFVDGMNWDNIGEWHIDHIIPLSSAETEQETIKLCHYTNLQPLWAFDNMSKGNKLDWVKE